MIWNYLLSGFRNLWRNRLFSSINILGLSLGIASVLMVALYLRYELTFDRHNENADRIYRIVRDRTDENGDATFVPSSSTGVVDEWFPQLQGVEAYTRYARGRCQVYREDNVIPQSLAYFEPGFFQVFTNEIIVGNRETFLHDPYGIILTRETAEKYFGHTQCVGEILRIRLDGEMRDMRVDGIIENWPENSSIQFEMILPFSWRHDRMMQYSESQWSTVYSHTYVLLQEGVDVEQFTSSLHAVQNGEEGHWSRDPLNYDLQPLSMIHIAPNNPRNFPVQSDGKALKILMGIGMVILSLACINYTMLTIGRSLTRQREVGVRKVLGASRNQVGQQFWIETMILTSVAILPAVALVDVALPFVRSFAGVYAEVEADVYFFGTIVAIWALTVLVAGFYPSLVLSAFPVLESLKGLRLTSGRGRLRSVMITFQITVTAILCSIALIMLLQMRFVHTKELGYHGDQVVSIRATSVPGLAIDALGRLRHELNGETGILSMTAAACTFGPYWNRFFWEEEDGGSVEMWHNSVDVEFLETMGIHLEEGRNFDLDNPADFHSAMIVNRAFVEYWHLENPIGATIPRYFGDGVIIGVTENFHFHDLREEIEPVVIGLSREMMREADRMEIEQEHFDPSFVLVSLDAGSIPESMTLLRQTWQRVVPESAFRAEFISDIVDAQYREYYRWNRAITTSTALSLLIALFGLAGTAAMQVAKKTKEIGIRKVLGASVSQILLLLSCNTVVLVVAATVISWPVTWFIMKGWLAGFAYRIPISPVIFVGIGVGILIMTVVVIASISYRVANSNPSLVLRDE